ncbi:MAG: aminotransferase class I/II-fold pyridoxal phosphate-dependent enzyme [Nitriliruptoraceae bacterium]
MTTASASAVGPPPGMDIRLSSNESPFGPSPAAIEAARHTLDTAHLYPDDQSTALREAIAAHESITVEQVAVGTGSAALLMDAISHAAAGGTVLAFERSFIVYRLAAANVDAGYLEVSTGGPPSEPGPGYQRDVDALLAQIDNATKVVVIDNPGNPTGAHLTADALSSLIDQTPEHVTVIIDEAYHQFAASQRGYATVAELPVTHPRLLTLRTFSKAYALAGMRVGYLMGEASLVGAIDARRTRFNVAAASQAAALAALADLDHLQATVDGSVAGRGVMAAGLRDIGVPFTDGLGNFLTIELGIASPPVVDAFARYGVGVRSLEPYDMLNQIRVSVGIQAEVDGFLGAARDVLANVPSRQ